jgi:uncharacterized UPF0146 family protein
MHVRITHDNFSPGLKRLHDKIFNPGLSSTPGLKMLHVIRPPKFILSLDYFNFETIVLLLSY